MGDEFAEVIADPVPAESEALARQAADDCPVEAIIVE
jgi:ferredoxin